MSLSSQQHNPGGKVRLQVDLAIQSNAHFSPCGRYRPWLTRVWDSDLSSIMFVGMNPSTADHTVDDPTVRKECHFAKSWGYGGLIKFNVMDYRATNPKQLLTPGLCVRSDENLTLLAQHLAAVDVVVAAWGNLAPSLRHYADDVISLLKNSRVRVLCLGYNKDRSPKHPLYLKNTSQPMPFQMKDLSNAS